MTRLIFHVETMNFNKFLLCFAVLQSSIDDFFKQYKENYGESCHSNADRIQRLLKEDIYKNNPVIKRDNLDMIFSHHIFTEYLNEYTEVDDEIIKQIRIVSEEMFE